MQNQRYVDLRDTQYPGNFLIAEIFEEAHGEDLGFPGIQPGERAAQTVAQFPVVRVLPAGGKIALGNIVNGDVAGVLTGEDHIERDVDSRAPEVAFLAFERPRCLIPPEHPQEY